jgi:hypothetical protein
MPVESPAAGSATVMRFVSGLTASTAVTFSGLKALGSSAEEGGPTSTVDDDAASELAAWKRPPKPDVAAVYATAAAATAAAAADLRGTADARRCIFSG